jgi:predicted DNA-binding transcriptional regulator YafY
MTKLGRGAKRSSWATFKRRLLLVRLLLQQPASKAELVRAVQAKLQDNGYPNDADSALKNDFEALKREFGCEIAFDRKQSHYAIRTLGELALLDLSDDCFDALLFLDANYPQGDALPKLVHMRTLLNQIILLLPHERRQILDKRLPLISRISASTDHISHSLLERLVGVLKRQQIAFEYRSNSTDIPQTWHRVAPYDILFKPDGHVYLDAATLEVNPSESTIVLPATTNYRLDRIIEESVKVLPSTLPPQRIGQRIYPIRYWLHPNVARRRDITAHFEDTEISYNDDGSAEVSAKATNLWQARQTLFRYGSACVVQEPPELVELFKKAIREMSENYSA